MEYSIRALSEMAGVSARTLRYYDEIGLLKPSGVSEAGYRYYGDEEVAVLQQILFYRERGFELKKIQKILYQDGFDIMSALEEHLLELEAQREHVDLLIRTVRKTISSMRGEMSMSDQEKFAVFKEKLIKENEEKYGAEVREKYGTAALDESNRKLMNMSEADWEDFRMLEQEILTRLKEGVAAGISPESEEARQITVLHRRWLEKTWKQYPAEAHRGLAAMYAADERFRAYYDREADGCAALLESAICRWAGKI